MTKNKRYKLQEESSTAEEVFSLKDILEMSTKAETSASGLLNASVDSKNTKLLGLVAKFKDYASQITQYVSHLIMKGKSGLGDEEGGDTRIDLNRESKEIKESAKQKYLKRKKLKEAEGEDDETWEFENDKKESIPSTSSTENEKVVIDLTEPFEKIIKGLDEPEFDSFKQDVISKLEVAIDSVEQKTDSTKADEFTKSIEALAASSSVDDFDLGMNQLYDFADQNEILIETVKKK